MTNWLSLLPLPSPSLSPLSLSPFFLSLPPSPSLPHFITGMKGDIGPRGPKGSIGSIGPMGDTGAIGQKGGKGEIGQMGPPSSSGTMSSDGLVSWNQCSWANLNAGQNYGQIAVC